MHLATTILIGVTQSTSIEYLFILSFLQFSLTKTDEQHDLCPYRVKPETKPDGSIIWCYAETDCDPQSICAPIRGLNDFGDQISYCCSRRLMTCSAPPLPGYGECGTQPREMFYFDNISLRCKKFVVVQCFGVNENQFATLRECQALCIEAVCRLSEKLLIENSRIVSCGDGPCPQSHVCRYDKLFRHHVCCKSMEIETTDSNNELYLNNDKKHDQIVYKRPIRLIVDTVNCSAYANQLYEDLLYFYNKNVRPVRNASSAVQVKFGASLIRIIEVDEVNQVLTTNLWLEMQWFDYRLMWDVEKWGNIQKLYIPVDQIWIPDVLLYNNADGEPHITVMSDASVYYTGAVVWKPPSIYKSLCPIDIEYFPYDKQSCNMKFGGWSYNGFLMDVRQLPSHPTDVIETHRDERGKEYQFLEVGMDLSSYHPSLEWDLMSITSKRHEELYPGCCGQEFYIDISFEIHLRRKTLFYTVNLVIPCMLIAILTTTVFYIPGNEHKITFSNSILVTLTVFYLVLIERIPPTSLVIPLIGKYILFTMLIVSSSIMLSVSTVNFYRRSGTAHPMPNWLRRVFLKTLPRYLFIKPPDEETISEDSNSIAGSRRGSPYFLSVAQMIDGEMRLSHLAQLRGMHQDLIRRMIDNVSFISDHFRALEKEDRISEDWSYIAMIMDRILFIIYSVVNFFGTLLILLNSPVLYDNRLPLAILPASKPLSGDSYDLLYNRTFSP